MAVKLSTVRIIAGTWRSRRIQFPSVQDLRPTGDRIRETLFNWLQHEVPGARCLDAFAGSGVLGFEALSRGAASVTFIDPEPMVATAILHNGDLLEAQDQMQVLCMDTLDYLHRTAPEPFDIVFCDPPFRKDLLAPTLEALTHGWLKPKAYLYIEQGQPFQKLIDTQHFDLSKIKKAGEVFYGLLQYKSMS